MRFDVRYVSRFSYRRRSALAERLARLPGVRRPPDLAGLPGHHHAGGARPVVRRLLGTRVDTFGIRSPHELLEVVAEATVETQRGGRMPPVRERPASSTEFVEEHGEYLERSPHTAWSDTLHARRVRAPTRRATTSSASCSRSCGSSAPRSLRAGVTYSALRSARYSRRAKESARTTRPGDRGVPVPRHPGALSVGLPVHADEKRSVLPPSIPSR